MELGEFLKTYWSIIATLGGIVLNIIWLFFRMQNAEKTLQNHSARMNGIDQRVSKNEDTSDVFRESIQISLQEIKTTLSFVREAIEELKKK